MAQLSATHIGWENEHLAKFLLSRFAFVAQPVTVGDDLGVDFYCTTFQRKTVVTSKGKHEELFPRRSFAIQVKSNHDIIHATKHAEYLSELQMPFFVGVVSQSERKLDIYSGEILPLLFSSVMANPPMDILLFDGDFEFSQFLHWRDKGGVFEVRFIKVTTLRLTDGESEIVAALSLLEQRCEWMLSNITSRAAREYIFAFPRAGTTYHQFVAGPGSLQSFRSNLFLRLAEAFYNMKLLLDQRLAQFQKEEFLAYQACYLTMIKLGNNPPEQVQKLYEGLLPHLSK